MLLLTPTSWPRGWLSFEQFNSVLNYSAPTAVSIPGIQSRMPITNWGARSAFRHLACQATPPMSSTWSYRSTGPFSLPQRAYGAYSVLLTLRFFGRVLNGATTPLLSFTAKKAGAELEADLALFFQESKDYHKQTILIFAECKSHNEFARADADRMSALAEHFPGAVLVFATLNKTPSKKEQTVLRPVVNRGRRLWKTGHPFNPVLILTGTELFSRWRPSQAWRDAGGKHATFANYHSWPRGELLTVCDTTQQLYLDLPPWDRWLDRRRRRNLPPPASSAPSPSTSARAKQSEANSGPNATRPAASGPETLLS